MFSSEEVEKAKNLVAKLSQFNLGQDCIKEKGNKGPKKNRNQKNGKGQKKKDSDQQKGGSGTGCITLLPSELLVIAGIICDVLQVNSVLVNRNHLVEIILVGSLKRPTQLDKVMEQIGKMPFDQVVKSIMECSTDG